MAAHLLDLPLDLLIAIIGFLSLNPIDPLFLNLACCCKELNAALHHRLHGPKVWGVSAVDDARRWFIRAGRLCNVLLGPRYKTRHSVRTLPTLRRASFMTRTHTDNVLQRIN